MGCGRVGSTLAHRLEERGHSLAVIDSDADAFRRLGPSFSGMTVTGLGFDRDVQRRAGIERADAFAAVSSGDNSNIISARVAREQFGVDTVVARIYDPGRAEVYERLGVPTVATVTWAADQVLRKLLPAGHDPVYRDPSGEVRADQVLVPAQWVGSTVAALEAATGGRVACLTRFGSGLIPADDTVLQDGDVLQLFSAIPDSADVFSSLEQGPREEQS
ncbi:potassium channel family protein [Mumia sp. DW29H23]|uniref:potassium channel family protein n=1 Tax=Mumia sp. DW29H23 TaxID=3421241 RepID=UPI003D680C24